MIRATDLIAFPRRRLGCGPCGYQGMRTQGSGFIIGRQGGTLNSQQLYSAQRMKEVKSSMFAVKLDKPACRRSKEGGYQWRSTDFETSSGGRL